MIEEIKKLVDDLMNEYGMDGHSDFQEDFNKNLNKYQLQENEYKKLLNNYYILLLFINEVQFNVNTGKVITEIEDIKMEIFKIYHLARHNKKYEESEVEE